MHLMALHMQRCGFYSQHLRRRVCHHQPQPFLCFITGMLLTSVCRTSSIRKSPGLRFRCGNIGAGQKLIATRLVINRALQFLALRSIVASNLPSTFATSMSSRLASSLASSLSLSSRLASSLASSFSRRRNLWSEAYLYYTLAKKIHEPSHKRVPSSRRTDVIGSPSWSQHVGSSFSGPAWIYWSWDENRNRFLVTGLCWNITREGVLLWVG